MLDLKEVRSGYGVIQVLKGISLKVGEQEMVTLIGANGAGKTTTLKTIMGVLPATHGTITFNQKPIHSLPTYQIVKRGIALCPEGRRIFPNMSVSENLALGALYTTEKRKKEILDQVFTLFPILKERSKQLAGTFSGGEQQMLAIARALMTDPKLLLLDEPSLGLSPILVQKIFEILQEINRKGIPILLVEQNAHQALSISHRAYVIETGEIVLAGKSADLLQNEKVKAAYLGGI